MSKFVKQVSLMLAMIMCAGCLAGCGSVNMVSGGEGSDADWIINIRTICPEVGTCDIAFWYFLIEVPKGVIREEDKVRIEYVGDKFIGSGQEEIPPAAAFLRFAERFFQRIDKRGRKM